MPIQAFVDESGGRGHTRHFLMAGLISHSADWTLFSDEWRACLSEHPRVDYFKMSEAAACTGKFHRFTETQRDDKLRELARIINRRVGAVTFACVDLEAHADVWAKHFTKPHSEEYFWPYQNTIMAACFHLWDSGLRERFEIIFDQQVIFGPRARAWYPLLQDVIKAREPDAATILPVDPMFRDDKEFLPLQAADLYAWCSRDATDNRGPSRFEWLLGELSSVKATEYSQYYDRDRMNSVVELSYQCARDGKITPELIAKWQEIAASNRKR